MIDTTDISVAVERMGELSNLLKFSAMTLMPAIDSSLIIKCVPHPLCCTAVSKSIYAALAAMMTTGPRAGSVATILPSVLARSLAKIGFKP